jgi:hypothetical protein
VSDIDLTAYTRAVDYAVMTVDNLIFLRDAVLAGRGEDPDSFPAVVGDFAGDAIARRIIAALLDEGWTPPSADELRAKDRRRNDQARRLIEQLRAGEIPEAIAQSLDPSEYATQEQLDEMADRIEARIPPEETP